MLSNMLRVCALITVFLQNIPLQLLPCHSRDHLRDSPEPPILSRRKESINHSRIRLHAYSEREKLGNQAEKKCGFLPPMLKSRALHYNPIISGEAYTFYNRQVVARMEECVFL